MPFNAVASDSSSAVRVSVRVKSAVVINVVLSMKMFMSALSPMVARVLAWA